MIVLDLPPQIEIQVIQTAKQQNMSANDYVAEELIDVPAIEDYELYQLTGFIPFKTKNRVTNDMVNALREEYGI